MAIDWAALGSAAKSAAASSAKQAAAQMGTAAIASGGGFLSQLFFGHKNWKRTKELNQQTYQYNKNLAELAFKQNVEMWNAENAYNTPAAQMMRMRAAGLNPNLLYGNGQEASAGNASDAPELQYGQYDPKINYFDPTGAAFEGLNYAASLRQINSLVDLQASQAQLNQSESTLKDLETALKDKDYYWYDTVVASNLAEQNARTNNLKYQSGFYKAYTQQARETARKIGYDSKKLEVELRYFDDICQKSLEISGATVKEIQQRTKNYPVQRAEMYGKISEMAANVQTLGELGYKYHIRSYEPFHEPVVYMPYKSLTDT